MPPRRSGVMTMPAEATENAGPIIIWRKELRPDSGGAGAQRGGLGQHMEVGAVEGHEFDISAMFDRVNHPARGRRGGESGAPTTIERSDGAPMRGKGKQFIPHGEKVVMAFPGGAGYGDPKSRDHAAVRRDLARGYISVETARTAYGLSEADIGAVAIMGASTAWFLTDNPDFDGSVLVVERDPSYENCSTTHTNSCMRQQFSTDLNVRISQFAADFVKNLRQYMVL